LYTKRLLTSQPTATYLVAKVCLIIWEETAVYGLYNAPEVMVLRRFRDETLLTTW
jgi:hypothetical protein